MGGINFGWLASRRPAHGHLFEDGPEAQGTTGKLAAQSSRQLGSAEDRLAYATVVAGVPSLKIQVGDTSPLPTVQFPLNPLPHPRQPLGACLLETCPDCYVACLMAPLQTTKWLQVMPPHR